MIRLGCILAALLASSGNDQVAQSADPPKEVQADNIVLSLTLQASPVVKTQDTSKEKPKPGKADESGLAITLNLGDLAEGNVRQYLQCILTHLDLSQVRGNFSLVIGSNVENTLTTGKMDGLLLVNLVECMERVPVANDTTPTNEGDKP